MKTKLWLVITCFGGVLLSSGASQTVVVPARSRPASSSAASPPKAPVALTLAEAQQKVATAPVRYPAHPSASRSGDKATEVVATKPDFMIATPPPAPRAETKPAAPTANHVWVPGHYMPDKGKWVWVAGEWSVPATPSSVWIEARYDANEMRWAPGYWQPDRPAAPDTTTPAIESSPDNPTYR